MPVLNIQNEELYDQYAAEGETTSRFIHALMTKRCECGLFLNVCAAYRHYRTSDNSRSSIMDRACGVNSLVCVSA